MTKYKYKRPAKRKAKAWKSDRAFANYDYIRALKESTPCADCGKLFPACVLDFDHVRGKKVGNVSVGAQTWTLDKVKAEIAKCELVCCNCHRIRTHITRKGKG